MPHDTWKLHVLNDFGGVPMLGTPNVTKNEKLQQDMLCGLILKSIRYADVSVVLFLVLADNSINTPAMPMFFGARTNRRVFLCLPSF